MKEGPDRLLTLLLSWTLFTLIPFWLILTRAGIEQDQYTWGLPGLQGVGRGEQYWVIPLLVTFGLSLLYLGLRGARPPFHFMLLAWHVVLTTVLALEILAQGSLTVSGDSWSFRFRLGLLALTVPIGFTLAGIYWVARDLSAAERPGSVMRNPFQGWLLAGAALLALPIVALFRTGENYGTGDEIAVGLTIVQLILLVAAFYPAGGPPSAIRGPGRGRVTRF